MPLFAMNDRSIAPVAQTTFAAAGIRERADLQRLLRDNIEVISPSTLVIAEEFGDWDGSQRRIDLLGVDREANLVVIELKRDDDGAHMELQSLRYAAMVARMTFDEAVATYTRFLASRSSDLNATASLLDFLGWLSPTDGEFARAVRIVLASGDFSQEITSTVLWLNEHELDVTCIRVKPYRHCEQLLLNVEQIIPLPEAADYQIQIRNKARESRSSGATGVDRTQYDIVLGAQKLGPLRKRRMVYEVIRHLVRLGKTAETLEQVIGRGNLWAVVPGVVTSEELRTFLAASHSTRDARYVMRFFTDEEELFRFEGDTFALTNQWGSNAVTAVDRMIEAFPEAGISYSVHETS